jgi:hypothetical protein
MCDLVAEDESMNKPLTMFGALTLSAVALVRAASRSSSETQIYAGEIFEDRMTETSISGSPPRLHESTTFGGRYRYEFTDTSSLTCGLSAGYSQQLCSGYEHGGDDVGRQRALLTNTTQFQNHYLLRTRASRPT